MGRRIVVLLSLLVLISTSAFADSYQMASGYTPGKLDVSFFGNGGGVTSEIAKLYVTAGATRTEYQKCPACPWASIEFANDNSQAIIVREKAPTPGAPGAPPGTPSQYQWNFSLSPIDAIQVNTMGPGLGFNGPVARTLYTSLEKSKAPIVGWTANNKGQPTTPVYMLKSLNYSIYCQLQVKASTTSCYIGMH